jgi:hypothetical protein
MIRWPINTSSWMAAALIVAFALAAIVFAIFGVGNRGTMVALRLTARWSFLLFWLAYAGGALARRCGPRLSALGRYGRELGLAFASAQLVHVGLILWLVHIATEPSGAMVFFWIGIACTYLLALFSLPRLRDALGPRLWRAFCTIALEYIAIVFAADFILLPLWGGGFGKYPLTYLPFAIMLVGGAGLRVAAFSERIPSRLRELLPSRVTGPPVASQFCRMSREDNAIEGSNSIRPDWRHQVVNREQRKDRLIVWPLGIFVGVILTLLAFDHAFGMLFAAALGLYGPLMLICAAYILLKYAIGGVKFVGSQFN